MVKRTGSGRDWGRAATSVPQGVAQAEVLHDYAGLDPAIILRLFYEFMKTSHRCSEKLHCVLTRYWVSQEICSLMRVSAEEWMTAVMNYAKLGQRYWCWGSADFGRTDNGERYNSNIY